MFCLEHKVRVFVFRMLADRAEYLLVRRKPRSEWPFGPVIGPLGVGEHLRDAVVREVRDEVGLSQPLHLIELHAPNKELFGEVGLVEWPFGYQAGAPHQPAPTLVPGPMIGEFDWLSFEQAYQAIETLDRELLVKLQLRLRG